MIQIQLHALRFAKDRRAIFFSIKTVTGTPQDIVNLVNCASTMAWTRPLSNDHSINRWQKTRFVRKMVHTMFNTIAGKRIAVLGLAFKKDTNDTREPPAIDVGSARLSEHAELGISDRGYRPR